MNFNLNQTLFWVSGVLLFYTFLGYPLLMYGLAWFRGTRLSSSASSEAPSVTVVLAAYNEEARIVARLHNLLSSQYPETKLNVIVVSDGSGDGTVREIQALNNPRVHLVVQPQRRGKAQALNLALAGAQSDVIVFTDVRQSFAPNAIAQLVNHFAGSKIGAVSGELWIDPAVSAVGGGVDTYWRLEKFIRLSEARWDSCIGCTGAIYAIRRSLFQPLPDDTILDDVVIPMQISLQGYRIVFEPAASAYDPQSLEPDREQVRKRRTLAGNYQMLFRYPAWMLPWRNRLWWQLLSHKYLRLAAPFLLILMFATNAMLIRKGFYQELFLGQCLFYGLAGCGTLFRSQKLFSIPAGFVFLNWMAASGLWHYLRRWRRPGWETIPDIKQAVKPKHV